MPVYVYGCKCGFSHEVSLKLKDLKKRQKCPKCPKYLKRIPSTTSFELLGPNWFKNSGEY